MLRTAQQRHPGRLVSDQPDSIWPVSTVKGRDGPLPSGSPVGRKWQAQDQTRTAFIHSRIQMTGQAAVEVTSGSSFLLSHSRAASSLPMQELASAASGSDPYGGSKREGPPTALITMSWEGPWVKSHTGLLGHPSGQRMPWDGTWLAWVDEWALEAKGQPAPAPQGSTPTCVCVAAG